MGGIVSTGMRRGNTRPNSAKSGTAQSDADLTHGPSATDQPPAKPGSGERDRLTVPQGLAALSLDALASVAYGPEAIVVVLAAAGSRGLGFTLPVTLAIVVLLGALTLSYRQVIAAFPNGGGAYAVAGRHLGRRVYRHGVLVLAGAALILLVVSNGNAQTLVPVFAIGVFIGFTISQVGMVKHWYLEQSPGWRGRAALNGLGALLTFAATIIELVAKFTEGGWLVFVAVILLVTLFEAIHRTYRQIGQALHLGEVPGPPEPRHSLVVVPVGAVNRLTQEAIGVALSLGDDVRAVTVVYSDDPEDTVTPDRLRTEWNVWNPNVPLTVLSTPTRSLTRPIVDHLRELDALDDHDRVVVLIPEISPGHHLQRLLQNQRGAILDRAIRRHSDAVICRLRFRIESLR
jgi:hypothetical protein